MGTSKVKATQTTVIIDVPSMFGSNLIKCSGSNSYTPHHVKDKTSFNKASSDGHHSGKSFFRGLVRFRLSALWSPTGAMHHFQLIRGLGRGSGGEVQGLIIFWRIAGSSISPKTAAVSRPSWPKILLRRSVCWSSSSWKVPTVHWDSRVVSPPGSGHLKQIPKNWDFRMLKMLDPPIVFQRRFLDCYDMTYSLEWKPWCSMGGHLGAFHIGGMGLLSLYYLWIGSFLNTKSYIKSQEWKQVAIWKGNMEHGFFGPLLDFCWPIPLIVAQKFSLFLYISLFRWIFYDALAVAPPIIMSWSHPQFPSKPGLPEDRCRRAMREVHFLRLGLVLGSHKAVTTVICKLWHIWHWVSENGSYNMIIWFYSAQMVIFVILMGIVRIVLWFARGFRPKIAQKGCPMTGPVPPRRSLSHPNVLRIESAFLHQFSLVLAVEFCDLGDLQVRFFWWWSLVRLNSEVLSVNSSYEWWIVSELWSEMYNWKCIARFVQRRIGIMFSFHRNRHVVTPIWPPKRSKNHTHTKSYCISVDISGLFFVQTSVIPWVLDWRSLQRTTQIQRPICRP